VIPVPSGVRVWLAFGRTDMRRGMNTLALQVLTDLTDHDAFFDLFYDEDLRFEFMSLFKTFTKCLNVVFPAKEALDYMSRYQRLAEINVLAGKHFRDERLSMKGIPPKLRMITDAYLESPASRSRSSAQPYITRWRSGNAA
jgi:hypothetical protein